MEGEPGRPPRPVQTILRINPERD
ncbi:hypothetical protein SBRY_10182 [Actinacidiphila bryophytorum]|uniref:Uncharacterized protein n=1 Tax=Actinacidiphila bryophytorum TaxID=1436133 RepID=A0A9W4E001_9ACTN|nr:hypothetical protein SBRY_10182 [Actinacidiphila bryophytorum]